MRHHAAQRAARATVQARADFEQQRIAGLDPRAMTVAVDLDQRGKSHAERFAFLRDHVGGFDAVEQDRDVRALPRELRDVVELVRRDPDRVQDVGDAVRKEIFGLFQRRNRDAAGLDAGVRARGARRPSTSRSSRAGAARCSSSVRCSRMRAMLRSRQVAIEDERGRFEIGEVHGRSIIISR